MAYISLKDFKGFACRLPDNSICLRITKAGKREIYFLNIPRQISTKAGIDSGSMVDIQFDKDRSMLRLQLTKEINGFKVKPQKHRGKYEKNPPSRVIISFPNFKGVDLPKLKHPVQITEYEFNQGLTMRIPEDGRTTKG